MQEPTLSKVLRDNRLYFILCLIFLALGNLWLLFLDKGEIILFFSENRTEFWNTFFSIGTRFGEELTYLFFVILFLFFRIRHSLAIPLIGIIVSLVAFITKWIFYIDRPGAYFTDLGILDSIVLVENVRLNTGPTSFPSGHTMSAFALFTFVALCIKDKTISALAFFLLALMIGISRVYLVQHFWQDIPTGAFLGILIALGMYLIHWKWGKVENHWMDKNLFHLRDK